MSPSWSWAFYSPPLERAFDLQNMVEHQVSHDFPTDFQLRIVKFSLISHPTKALISIYLIPSNLFMTCLFPTQLRARGCGLCALLEAQNRARKSSETAKISSKRSENHAFRSETEAAQV